MISKWIPSDMVSRILLLVASLLVVVIVFEITEIVTGQAADLVAVDDSTSLPAISPNASNANKFPPLSSFSEILQRPVYEATRRPVQKRNAVVDSASADLLRKKWRLSGVIMDDNNIAIMETQRSGETLSLVAGQLLESWRVQEIDANEIVLIRGGESLRFTLHDEDANAASGRRQRVTQTWKPSEK